MVLSKITIDNNILLATAVSASENGRPSPWSAVSEMASFAMLIIMIRPTS